jgi:hypothetical protein
MTKTFLYASAKMELRLFFQPADNPPPVVIVGEDPYYRLTMDVFAALVATEESRRRAGGESNGKGYMNFVRTVQAFCPSWNDDQLLAAMRCEPRLPAVDTLIKVL